MKKLIKFLAWTAGVVVVLLIVAVIGLKLFFPVEKVREMAVEEGSAALNRPLAVDNLDLSFWGGLGVNLKGVTLGNPEGFEGEDLLKAEGVDVKLQIFPLISGEYRVDRLIVNKPVINLAKRADGSNNFTFEMPDSALVDSVLTPEQKAQLEQLDPDARAAAVAVSFDQLEINEGHVVYVDDSTGMKAVLGGFDLSTSLANPETDVYRSAGKMNIQSLEITTDEPMPKITLGLNYDVLYDMGAGSVEVDRADLNFNGLQLDVSGQATELFGDTKAKVAVKSDGISVRDLLGMLSSSQKEALEGFKVDGDFSLDAEVGYDAARGDDALDYTGNAVISNMAMSKSDIEGELVLGRALLDFKTDNLRMTIEDGTFNGEPLKGYLTVDDFENPTINAELSGSFNLGYVLPFIPVDEAEPVTHKLAGDADFDVKFSGKVDQPADMNFSGDLVVKGGSYSSELMPEPVESFEVDMHFDRKLVNVRKLTGTFPSGTMSFDGRITDLLPYLMADSTQTNIQSPSIDGHLKGDIDLANLNRFLPEKGDPEMAGQFGIDLRMSGRVADYANFKPRGTITVTNASYRDSLLAEPIEAFDLAMEIVPDTLKINKFNAKFTSSDVNLTGRVLKPFPYLLPMESIDRSRMKKPAINMELVSSRFDMDKLFPEAVPGSGARVPQTAEELDSVSIIMLPDVEGTVNLRADTVIYSMVEFTQITGVVKIQNRQITVTKARGKVYSGDVSGITTIDLRDMSNPHYVGKFEGTNIEANDFISRFSKFGGHLYGKANMEGSYDAYGWEPDAFLNSLTVNSIGTVKEGKLITSGATYSLLAGLAKNLGEDIQKEQTLKNLTTKISVKDGKIMLDDMVTKLGNIGDLKVSGSLGMINNDLDYTGSILLSEAMSKKVKGKLGGLAGLLGGGGDERMTLPLTIGGTIDDPKVALDMNALTENLKGNLGGALQNLIDKNKK